MKIGIVGSEGAKFTLETELKAREQIRYLLDYYDPTLVVSGGCHLGGIDKWAIQEASQAKIAWHEFIPVDHTWMGGYKPRNIKIAEASDLVVCITVKQLPPDYTGMRFKLYYHCGTDEHVKSGGCWTMKYAKKIGKQGQLVVIA